MGTLVWTLDILTKRVRWLTWRDVDTVLLTGTQYIIVVIHVHFALIKMTPCTSIVVMYVFSMVAATVVAQKACERDWTLNPADGACYRRFRPGVLGVIYSRAVENCLSQGAVMAEPTSPALNTFINDLRCEDGCQAMWLPMTYNKTGDKTWRWESGDLLT